MARNTAVARKSRTGFDIRRRLDRIFIREKLQNSMGYFLVACIAGLMGFLIAKSFILGMGVLGAAVGLAVVMVCMLNVEAGLYINIAYCFVAFHFSRLFFNDTLPTGVLSDGLAYATFLGLFLQRIAWRETLDHFVGNTIAAWTLILLAYLGIELFNPYAHSVDGWFLTFRKMVTAVLLLFISFNIFTTYAAIRRFFITLFCISTAVAFYGCLQQWHGLFDFEKNWAMADELRFGLLFIGGDFRKFSTFSDPTAFGVVMAAMAILFSVVAMAQKRKRNRNILLTGVVLMLLAMAYSGTRTANAMMVAGVFMFILLTINKKATQVFAIFSVLIFLALLYVPYYANPTLNRFRSTFVGSNDESFNVREVNRAFVRPYMHSHPIGGGLGTVGEGGKKFNPGHYLAGFPPDSGYLKKALETGWIGLAICMILYFVILRSAIDGYFTSKNEKTKTLYAGCAACMFSFYVAEFPQEALGQITDVVIYYPLVAIIIGLRILDKKMA